MRSLRSADEEMSACRGSRLNVCYLGVVKGSDVLYLCRRSNEMEKGKWLSLFLFCLSHACVAVVGFSEGWGGCDSISIYCSKGEEGRERDDRLVM